MMAKILRSASERSRLVAEYRQSNMSARSFAKKEGIALTTFQNWLYKPELLGQSQDTTKPTRFVRVEVEKSHDGTYRLNLGTNVVLHSQSLFEPEYIARLVRALSC